MTTNLPLAQTGGHVTALTGASATQPQPSSAAVGSPYLVLAIGSFLLSVAVAVMLVDYCKHLRRSGVFDRHANKHLHEMYRRQALMTITEIPSTVEMIGPLLIHGIHQKNHFEKIVEEETELLLSKPPEDEATALNHASDNHAVIVEEQLEAPRSSDFNLCVNNEDVKSPPGSSRSSQQESSRTRESSFVAANTSKSTGGAKSRLLETSKSNSQMALLLKNYGTFDSQVELQFFNETVPSLESVTRYLPMKGQTVSMTILQKNESIDEAVTPPRQNVMSPSASFLSRASSSATLKSSSRMDADDSSTAAQGRDDSQTSSCVLLPSLIPRLETASTPNVCSSTDPLLAPQQQDGSNSAIPTSEKESVSSVITGRAFLTPPKFLLLYRKSSSDTTCLFDNTLDDKVNDGSVSSAASSTTDDDTETIEKPMRCQSGYLSIEGNGFMATPPTRKAQSSSRLSSVKGSGSKRNFRHQQRLLTKAASPMYSTPAEKMTARLAQLYDTGSPRKDTRTGSFTDCIASKQRLMLIEIQKLRHRAETIRRRKRRLNGGHSNHSIDNVYGRGGGHRIKARLLINQIRVRRS